MAGGGIRSKPKIYFGTAVNMAGMQEHLPLIAVAGITLVILFVLYRDLQHVKERLAACDSVLATATAAPEDGDKKSTTTAAALTSAAQTQASPARGAAATDKPVTAAVTKELKPALKQ